MQQLLNEAETAQRLRCTVAALRRWRRERRGPRFVRMGRLIRYSETALIEFIESHTEGAPIRGVRSLQPARRA
jgi:hypothetical protein